MTSKILVSSLKGGVGKTFLSVNLATYLAYYLDKKVLLLDLNLDNANSFLYINFKPVILNTDELWQGICPTSYRFHIKIQNTYNPQILYEKLSRAFPIFKQYYDFIIVDSPTRFDVIKSIEKFVDINLLIVTPDYLSLYSNYWLFKNLDKSKTKVVLNKDDRRFDLDIYEMVFGKPLFAVIPFNNDQRKAEVLRTPLVILKKNSPITRSIENIIEVLIGEKIRKSILDTIKELLWL